MSGVKLNLGANIISQQPISTHPSSLPKLISFLLSGVNIHLVIQEGITEQSMKAIRMSLKN